MKSPSSETSEDPINELIVQPAKKRARSPTPVGQANQNSDSLSDGQIAPSNEEEDEVDESGSETGELNSLENEDDDSVIELTGVVLYDPRDKVTEQQQKIAKLLRAPRYFEVGAEEETVRCFKCGQGGHLGRQCPNRGYDRRPCTLCAEYGHAERDCPNRLCFKCGEIGHLSRECKKGKQQGSFQYRCIRCGRYECNASGRHDHIRYDGGCDQDYQERDMAKVICLSCNKMHGTFCCALPPRDAVNPSCAQCGQQGHWIQDCTRSKSQNLFAEKLISSRSQKSLVEQEQQLRQAYGEQPKKFRKTNSHNSLRGGGGGGRGRGRGRFQNQHQKQRGNLGQTNPLRGGRTQQVWHQN